jgi:hypothetical protein
MVILPLEATSLLVFQPPNLFDLSAMRKHSVNVVIIHTVIKIANEDCSAVSWPGLLGSVYV